VSHIVVIETQVRDAAAVLDACARLRWRTPQFGNHRLFVTSVDGLAVYAPDWRFPIVCDLPSGRLHYDNYGGLWGNELELDRFKQRYAVEKATQEARRLGRSVIEQTLTDGTIRLEISAGVDA
jgi:hypothetical protein